MTNDERATIALERIANALEGLLESTNPIRGQDMTPIDDSVKRVFYSDEVQDMVQFHLKRMGKEYKERG